MKLSQEQHLAAAALLDEAAKQATGANKDRLQKMALARRQCAMLAARAEEQRSSPD